MPKPCDQPLAHSFKQRSYPILRQHCTEIRLLVNLLVKDQWGFFPFGVKKTLVRKEACSNATQATPMVTSGQNGAVNVTNITTSITRCLLPKLTRRADRER